VANGNTRLPIVICASRLVRHSLLRVGEGTFVTTFSCGPRLAPERVRAGRFRTPGAVSASRITGRSLQWQAVRCGPSRAEEVRRHVRAKGLQ
jgi:hypothetical protein